MSDDFQRVDVILDGEEARVSMSKSDLSRALQPSWLKDIDEGWNLMKTQLPGIVKQAIEEHEAEKEAALKKLREEAGIGKNPIRDFVLGNWGWIVAFIILFGILRPDLAGEFVRTFARF